MPKYNSTEELSAAIEYLEDNLDVLIDNRLKVLILHGNKNPNDEPGIEPENVPEGTIYLQLEDDE